MSAAASPIFYAMVSSTGSSGGGSRVEWASTNSAARWPTDAELEAALAHWKGERTFPANDFRKVRQGIASQRAAEFVEAHSTLLPPPEEPGLETIV